MSSRISLILPYFNNFGQKKKNKEKNQSWFRYIHRSVNSYQTEKTQLIRFDEYLFYLS